MILVVSIFRKASYWAFLFSLALLSACSEKMTVQFQASEQTVAKATLGGNIRVNLKRSSRRTLGLPFAPSTHTSDEVLVPYTVSGTATPGVIHNLSSGTLRIPSGTDGNSLQFQILDSSFQGIKTIVVQLSAPKDGKLGNTNTHTVYLGDGAIAGQILINNGDLTTQSLDVTLTFSASGINQMYVTNTSGCATGGSWESYATTKSWTLGQSNSLATVYVKFRDAALNETECYSDDITHESFNPVTAGAVVIDGGDRDDHGFATSGPDNILGTTDDVNHDGWLFIEQLIDFAKKGNLNNAPQDVLVVGASSIALNAIQSATIVQNLSITVKTGSQLSNVDFNNYKILYVPGDQSNTPGGVSNSDLSILKTRRLDIQTFVNGGGSLVALTEEGSSEPFGWLELPLPFQIQSVYGTVLRKTQAAIDAGFTISDTDLSNGTPYHNSFVGPPNFNGLVPFVLSEIDQVITLGFSSQLHKSKIITHP